MYHANQRQGTVATKSRSMVEGSTRKLYAQKHTGNARAGNIRTPVRKGGGVTFGKVPRDFRQSMPQKQRRLARNMAILAKIKADDAVVIDQLSFAAPKTREFAAILSNLKIDRSCLVATEGFDMNVFKSLRNLPRVAALTVEQLNAGDICRRRKLLFTRAALESLLAPAAAGRMHEA
jgi:large subunit ribosomal protein L4